MITINKTTNGMQSRLEKQQGFTLLEILVAVLLISVLIAGGLYFTDFGSKKESVDLTLMDKFIQSDMPQALLQAYGGGANLNSFSGVDNAAIIAASAFGTNAINGANGIWDVEGTPDLSTITIRLTFSDTDAEAFVDALVTRIQPRSPIASVTDQGVSLDIQYAY